MDEFHRIAFAVFPERYSLHSQHTARPFIFTFSLYDGNEKNETADSPSALCILPECGSSIRLKKRKQPLTRPGRMFLQNICVTMGRSL
jgi:hypothetical protein